MFFVINNIFFKSTYLILDILILIFYDLSFKYYVHYFWAFLIVYDMLTL
jgi:hypothetical protein